MCKKLQEQREKQETEAEKLRMQQSKGTFRSNVSNKAGRVIVGNRPAKSGVVSSYHHRVSIYAGWPSCTKEFAEGIEK